MMLAYQPIRSLATNNMAIYQGAAASKRTLTVTDKPIKIKNEIILPYLNIKKCNMKFENEKEVIEKMNDNKYGLSSGVYTSDFSRGLRVSNAIRAGITFVNTYRLISPSAPFGGIKQTGYGREGGSMAIKDYLNIKYTHLGLKS